MEPRESLICVKFRQRLFHSLLCILYLYQVNFKIPSQETKVLSAKYICWSISITSKTILEASIFSMTSHFHVCSFILSCLFLFLVVVVGKLS